MATNEKPENPVLTGKGMLVVTGCITVCVVAGNLAAGEVGTALGAGVGAGLGVWLVRLLWGPRPVPANLPAPPAGMVAGDVDRPQGKLLPGLLLAALIAGVAYGVYWLVLYIIGVESGADQETRFVFRRLEEAIPTGDPYLVALTLGLLSALLLVVGVSWLWRRYRGAGGHDSGQEVYSLRVPLQLGLFIIGALASLYINFVPLRIFWQLVSQQLSAEIGLVGVLFTYFLEICAITALMLLLAYGPIYTWYNFWRWMWKPVLVILLLSFTLTLTVAGFAASGAREIDPQFFWLPIVLTVLVVGIGYAIWMYTLESPSVGWLWAGFLLALRFTVYVILAGVFLLPALQTWEKNEQYSKVLILFDLTGSMNLSDELTSDGKPLPTRLDQVATFLTTAGKDDKDFLKRLQEKNPVTFYGFGGKLDEEYKELKGGQAMTLQELTNWLRIDLKAWVLDGLSPAAQDKVRASEGFNPDQPATAAWAAEWVRSSGELQLDDENDKTVFATKVADLPKKVDMRQQILSSSNYGDALLAMITRESNNMLAGVILVGDGQNNQGSPSTFEEIRRRAQFARVPFFTIGVGAEREQINIRITDLQAPEQAPPDDKFVVRVHADGEGLPDKEFDVELDVYLPDDDKPTATLKTTGKFIPSAGSVPHGQVEFSLDPADEKLAALTMADKGSGKQEFPEGEWKFIARIAKARGEAFVGKEHVSDPVSVQVIKKPLRVLLVAGGPTREYQFLRRVLTNEVDKKRAELSVYLQVTDPKGQRVQDVPNERLLKAFPDALKAPDDPTIPADERYYNLNMYDVIICFDPDWTKIPLSSLKLLQTWVQDQAGGLILVGGPIHTWQLARSGNADQLRPIIDMYPVRVEDSRLVGQNLDRPADDPWRLNFHKVGDEAPFLKLDESAEHPTAGWEEFFTGKPSGASVNPTDKVNRGFYAYYPARSVKAGATVVATFADPRGRMVREDDPNKTEEQPYLVTMPFGGGKVAYISSGEMWRLRLFKENYHERFWTKLARYAGAGTQLRQTARGVLVMSRQFTTGQPVRLEARLRGTNLDEPLNQEADVRVKVQAPEGVVMKPAEFKLQPKKEGDWDGWFRGQFEVKAPGEYRLDLSIPGTNDVLQSKFVVKESNPELDNPRPDFGLLYSVASPVTDLRVGDGPANELRQRLRGSVKPEITDKLTSAAPGQENEPRLFFDLQSAGVITDYLGNERKIQRSRGPVDDLWDHGPVVGYDNDGKPRIIALVLLIVVGLLSVEWLTRKLLRLA